jgi:hypothetical protein
VVLLGPAVRVGGAGVVPPLVLVVVRVVVQVLVLGTEQSPGLGRTHLCILVLVAVLLRVALLVRVVALMPCKHMPLQSA